MIDVGGGNTRTYDIDATRAGRRVEVSNVRGTVEVAEVTRSGQVVRTARFMATRVVAVVEHPALEPDSGGGARGKKANDDQGQLI